MAADSVATAKTEKEKYLFRETSEMFGMSRYYNVGGQNIDSVLLRLTEH